MSKIVFDIGGTHMRVARVSGNTIENIQKIDTPQASEAAFNALVQLIDTAAQGDAVTALAGGVAGIIRLDGTVRMAPSLPAWQEFPLGARLAEHVGVPVRIENDAALAALGEARFGAGKDAHIVAYFTVSTGLGGARIVDGVIDTHAQGFEPGHQVIESATGATLDRATCGLALEEKHGMLPVELSQEVYDAATPALAVGVWNAIVHWSPDVFVLGGSLMQEETGYRIANITQALEGIRAEALSAYQLPPLIHAALGDENGLYGAMALLAE